MAMLWSDETGAGAEAAVPAPAHELTDIEVDEVSLVDRPASGRRFVLFKRTPRVRRAQEEANKCSDAAAPMAELLKRADALQERLRCLEERAERLAGRIERAEPPPARQSVGAPPAKSLWAGIL